MVYLLVYSVIVLAVLPPWDHLRISWLYGVPESAVDRDGWCSLASDAEQPVEASD